MARNIHDQPLAAEGLTSFRYRGSFGVVMIGASDEQDALRQAERSTIGSPSRENLEVWTGQKYEPVIKSRKSA